MSEEQKQIKIKALKKLLLWFTYFAFVYLFILFFSDRQPDTPNIVDDTPKTKEVNYAKIKNNFSISDMKIKYSINDMVIDGEIKEDKILINGEEFVPGESMNSDYLYPRTLVKYLNNIDTGRYDKENNLYKYENVTVYLNEEKISKIVINDIVTYMLEYDY